jgi:hemoglobin
MKHHRKSPTPRICASGLLLSLAILGLPPAWADSPAKAITPASAYPVTPAPSLYDALGGKPGIRAVMDDLVQRLQSDPRIGRHFKDTKLDHLSAQLTDQVCQLAGGPCIYKGPDMKEAHEQMDITRADFNALVELAQQSMEAKGVPFTRQNQLLALLAPMYRDVVTAR